MWRVFFPTLRSLVPIPAFMNSANWHERAAGGDEERSLITGVSATGKALVVTHSEGGESIRLISAREATCKERTSYEEPVFLVSAANGRETRQFKFLSPSGMSGRKYADKNKIRGNGT